MQGQGTFAPAQASYDRGMVIAATAPFIPAVYATHLTTTDDQLDQHRGKIESVQLRPIA